MIFHGETILVVEHDQIIRREVCRALAREGYRIVQARSAEDAVRTAARHENNIDLLVTETSLPTSRGHELAELLKLDYPDLQVVYICGLSDAASVRRDPRSTVVVLQNPFRGERLRKAVREALQKQKHKPGGTSFVSALQNWWQSLELQIRNAVSTPGHR